MARSPKRQGRREAPARWLLLVHQLPPTPAYLRVKVWRRLQELGAVSLKNSVYVLPATDQAREDFHWLLAEIDRGGGEGALWEAEIAGGMTDPQIRGLFDQARDADYAELGGEIRKLQSGAQPDDARDKTPMEGKSQVARLRRRFGEIGAIDFFGATGGLSVAALLSDLEEQIAAAAARPPEAGDATGARTGELLGKTWVTRRGVHVDRIACAWLIRRFIDPEARFKFVAEKRYAAKRGELRFDMFEAEFTHEGDRCTYEVMLERATLDDAALRAIAEIVHDIDLKDGKFGREEAAGIAHVIAGLCMSQADDRARIERGSAVFDDAYALFRRDRKRATRRARP